MPSYGARSRKNLDECHPMLQKLFEEAIKHYDCSITCGHRNKEDQDALFDQGRSQVRYPQGKHNHIPSLAVDVAPYPIDYEDRERFYFLSGLIKGIAAMMDIPIRWGGDWDSDMEFDDQKFDDLPHFELNLPPAPPK